MRLERASTLPERLRLTTGETEVSQTVTEATAFFGPYFAIADRLSNAFRRNRPNLA